MSHPISAFDASTLNTIAQTKTRSIRERLVKHLESDRARAVGEALLEPPETRGDRFDEETRKAAAKLERWIDAVEEASAEAEEAAADESYAYASDD